MYLGRPMADDTREVIGTAHATVGPPEEKISQMFIAPCSY